MTASADGILSLSEHAGARQVGTLYQGAVVVVICEAVLETILDFSGQDLAREQGGFLLGRVYGLGPQNDGHQPDGPQYVVIRHFHPAIQAQGSLSSLTFTHESWAGLTREIEANFPGESLVGWQHTHPGLGVFLSTQDLFIHRNFFQQSWQVALVVDPRRQEFGFYHWRDSEVRDCGFVCVEDLSS